MNIRRRRAGWRDDFSWRLTVQTIAPQDRQAPGFTNIAGGGKQILGFSIPMIDGQHVVGQRGGGYPITAVDRRHRLIQQVIDRRTSGKASLVRGTHPTVAHVNILSSKHLST
jgi:hypothetical protein